MTQKIQLEKDVTPKFLEEIHHLPGGEQIKNCIQCGTCSGSCPGSYTMEYTPRQLFAMIRAGLRDEVLKSDTIWICASCYMCTARCPKNIKITDVMYVLKSLAIKEKRYPKSVKGPILDKIFADLVNNLGRVQEAYLTTAYFILTNIFGLIQQIPFAGRLFFQGRLSPFPKKIKNLSQLQAIIRKIGQLEEGV